MSIARYILPFLIVIVSGLMYVLYIQPTYTAYQILLGKKADFQTAIDNASEVRALQAKLLAEVEAIDPSDRMRLEKLLPASYDPVLVLYDLNTFTQKHGLALKAPGVTLPPVDTKSLAQSKVSSLNIKFSVSAPYAIFRSFMSDLERELSLRDIKSLGMTSTGGEGGALESSVFTYQIEVEAHAYHEKEKNRPKSTTP